MASGMRVWDASGNLQQDTSTNMGRILGKVNTSGGSGSITTDGFLSGSVWVSVSNRQFALFPNATLSYSITGNTLYWSINKGAPAGGSGNYYYQQSVSAGWPIYTLVYGVR